MEYNKNLNSYTKINVQIKRLTSQYLYNIKYTEWRKKRPELLHGIMQYSNQHKWREKHIFQWANISE